MPTRSQVMALRRNPETDLSQRRRMALNQKQRLNRRARQRVRPQALLRNRMKRVLRQLLLLPLPAAEASSTFRGIAGHGVPPSLNLSQKLKRLCDADWVELSFRR